MRPCCTPASPTKVSVCPARRAAVLVDGEQVGQCLAGVELVGQGVDHRYAGRARHLLEPRLLVGAPDDHAPPGDRAPGRCRRPTRRTPICASVPSMIIGKPPSSAIPDANEACVRRVGLSKSTATVRGPASGRSSYGLALSFSGELEHRRLLLGRQVVVAEEVAGHGCSAGPDACGAYAASRIPGQAARNESACSLGEDQRRRQPDPVGRRVVDDEPRLEGCREHLRGDGLGQVEAR